MAIMALNDAGKSKFGIDRIPEKKKEEEKNNLGITRNQKDKQ